MKINNPKTFWGGVMFAVIGGTFALIARGLKLGDSVLIPGYAMGVPARMGPAFFPFWLGLILFVLGIAIAAIGVRGRGGPEDAFPEFHWRPIFFILGAVVMFGLILRPLGMLLSGMLLILVASLGSREFRLKQTLILGVSLVTFCALVFVAGLKLPIPLCPAVEAIQSSVKFCRL
jgi:hypothetical protein